MKMTRVFSVVGWVSAAWVAGYASSCGQTSGGGTCSATCVSGCCDSAGLCQTGTTASACGSAGAVCQLCSASQLCMVGACVSPMTQMDAGEDAGVDAGVPDAGMMQTGDGGTCPVGTFCGRLLYTGTKTGVAVNFVLHNMLVIAGPPSKTAKLDAGTFPMDFEFPATSLFTGNPLAAGDYYFITWLDTVAGDSTSGPNYAVDPVSPPKTTPATPGAKQTLPASGGATPIDITLVDP